MILLAVNIDAMISCSIQYMRQYNVSYKNIYLSHRSISSQSSSIAGDEAVLFILMITALQQTEQEGNKDEENSQQLPFRRCSEKKRKEKKIKTSLVYPGERLVCGKSSMADAHVITLSYLCKKTSRNEAGLLCKKW